MPRRAGSAGSLSPGLLALYALSMMEKEGQVHGYRVAERIAERTEGGWRPGPGAIYPSLQKLVARGWARARSEGLRREYEITPAGRRFLAKIRRRQWTSGSSATDLTFLWAEVAGSEDIDSFLLMRLRRALDAVIRSLERADLPRRAARDLRSDVALELSHSLERLKRAPVLAAPMPVRGRVAPR